MSSISFSTWAFDESREGFVLGLGVGYQSTTLDFLTTDDITISNDYAGLAMTVRAGIGFSRQFVYSFAAEIAIYEAPDGIGGELVSYTNYLTGIVATYYFKPDAPSAYVAGGVGWGSTEITSASDSVSEDGSSFMFGGGYELMRHHSVEFNILSVSIPSKYTNINSIDSLSARLMYQYAFY